MQYDLALLPAKFAKLLASAGDRTAGVVTPHGSWLVRLADGSLQVDAPVVGSPDATVQGPALDVLLWLWNRSSENVTTTGDDETITLLRKVVAAVLGNRSED